MIFLLPNALRRVKRLVPCLAAFALLAPLAQSKPAEPASPQAEVFDVKDVDTPPKLLKRTRPRYPVELRRANVSGQALLQFVVDEKGRPRDIAVLKADHRDFAASAVKSVEEYRFEPALKNGQPVRVRLHAPIVFSINDEPRSKPRP